MKYHFQLVSRTAVRIELIAEDKREILLLEQFINSSEQDENLLDLFRKGIVAYNSTARLSKTKFMNFPKVALCTYELTNKAIEGYGITTVEAVL